MNLDWQNLKVCSIRGSYSHWPSGRCDPVYWGKEPLLDNDLWIFTNGGCTMETSKGNVKLNGESIVWMRPGPTYRVLQDPDNPLSLIYIHFDLVTPDGTKYFPELNKIPEVLHSFNHPQWSMMAQNILKLLRERTPASLELAATMLRALLMALDFYQVRDERISLSNRARKLALEAATQMENTSNYFESIPEMARKFHISRNAFTRIFTEYWQIPPQKFQIDQRIDRAKDLLLNSPLSLGEIAAQLGYADHYFFGRQFKKHTGMTPGAFRKKIDF